MSWFEPRRRKQARIAAVFLALPDERHYGYELSRRAKVRSGVVYPWLTKALAAGWIEDGWDAPEPEGAGCRWYRLTEFGRQLFPYLVRETPESWLPAQVDPAKVDRGGTTP